MGEASENPGLSEEEAETRQSWSRHICPQTGSQISWVGGTRRVCVKVWACLHIGVCIYRQNRTWKGLGKRVWSQDREAWWVVSPGISVPPGQEWLGLV